MQDAHDDATPTAIRREDYRPPAFLVDTVALHFDLYPSATLVRSRLRLRRNPAHGDAAAPLRLNGESLTLVSLRLDGTAVPEGDYVIEPDGALVIAAVPDNFLLEVETRIAPDANTEFSGLYLSGGNFFTQCEAEGFRRITCFPDRPDVMTRFTVTLAADRTRCPVLLSNGNPEAHGDAGDGRHWARWVDPHPKPSYLFALVAGDLVAVRDHFVTRSGRKVDLAIWVRRGDEDRCGHAMLALKTVDEMGRGRVRAGIRPRRVQHRRRVRLQHGRDGEQGAQRLQHEIRAGHARIPRPTSTTRESRPSSRTSTSTTGPATASPAATGSSCR